VGEGLESKPFNHGVHRGTGENDGFPCVPRCTPWLKIFFTILSKPSPFPIPAVHHALDAVFQVGDVEVNQQADVFLAEAQIREQLGLVDGVDGLDALDLDDDQVFY